MAGLLACCRVVGGKDDTGILSLSNLSQLAQDGVEPFSETCANLGKARLRFGSCFAEVCPLEAGLTSSPQA